MTRPRRAGSLPLAIPLLLGTLVYANALTCGFTNWDDPVLVLESKEIRSLRLSSLVRMFSAPVHKTYLPLRTLSYAVDYAAWGYSAWAFHATNLILHLCNVALVFVLARRLGGHRLAATLTALAVAVHPVFTEGVTWISGRKEALCGLFCLLSMLSYMRCVGKTTRNSRAHYVLCTLFLMCALLSKATAVSLPLAFVAYDVFARSRVWRMSSRQRVAHYAVLWGLALMFLAVHIHVAGGANVLRDYKGHTVVSNLLTTASALAQYARTVLLPVWLCCRYHFMAVTDPFTPSVWVGVAVAVGLLVWVVATARRGDIIGFGGAWCIAVFLPVSNLMPLSLPVAERYLYMPLFGLAFVLAVSCERHRPILRRAAPAALGLVLLFCAETVRRNGDWTGGYPLWRRVVRQFPICASAWENYADAELHCGRPERHRRAFVRSREALAALLREMAEASPRDPEAWTRLGRALSRRPLRRLKEAADAFQQALAVDPKSASAHYNLAVVYTSMSPPRVAEARRHCELAIRAGYAVDPRFLRYLDWLQRKGIKP